MPGAPRRRWRRGAWRGSWPRSATPTSCTREAEPPRARHRSAGRDLRHTETQTPGVHCTGGFIPGAFVPARPPKRANRKHEHQKTCRRCAEFILRRLLVAACSVEFAFCLTVTNLRSVTIRPRGSTEVLKIANGASEPVIGRARKKNEVLSPQSAATLPRALTSPCPGASICTRRRPSWT